MSCAPGDIDCRLDAIAAALNTGPDGWAIAAVVIAGIGVLASTAVAIAAYIASARAVEIADSSNRREDDRDDERQRERVDRWLAEFIGAATTYWTACDAFVKSEENEAFRERMNAVVVGEPPVMPKAGPMLGTLDSARLVARHGDRDLLRSLSDAVIALRDIEMAGRQDVMALLTGGVRDWRSGVIAGVELEKRLSRVLENAPRISRAERRTR